MNNCLLFRLTAESETVSRELFWSFGNVAKLKLFRSNLIRWVLFSAVDLGNTILFRKIPCLLSHIKSKIFQNVLQGICFETSYESWVKSLRLRNCNSQVESKYVLQFSVCYYNLRMNNKNPVVLSTPPPPPPTPPSVSWGPFHLKNQMQI